MPPMIAPVGGPLPQPAPPPLLGRAREQGVLRDSFVAALAGRGAIVLVAGEPGIGKTRLRTELAGAARADGWAVLTGRADDAEGLPPYLPIAEALRGYLGTLP